MKKNLILMAACISAGFTASSAFAEPVLEWTLQPIGLVDAEHTRDDGYQFSVPGDNYQKALINEAGQVLGVSNRYDGGVEQGESAWLFDGNETLPIGLRDSDHTDGDGRRYITPKYLNESGQVVGTSGWFYPGEIDYWWENAWIFDGSQTQIIGLMDPGYVSSDGARNAKVSFLNEAGQVAGYSYRVSGQTSMGIHSWFYDGNETQRIGLYDSEHTRAIGASRSHSNRPAYGLNEAGFVLGWSRRYLGVNDGGESVWLFDGSKTQSIGLIDNEHTRADGYRSSDSLENALNNSGQAAGNSIRFMNGMEHGKSAWFHDGKNTKRIGLINEEYTQDGGFQFSEIRSGINEAGQVIGTSIRFDGAENLGNSAWIYGGGETQRLGLLDNQHTKDNGVQNSEAAFINAAGQVVGSSIRYRGNDTSGKSAWVYSGSSTQRLGFSDAAHTSAQGDQYSEVTWFNDAGFAAGLSYRYDNGTIPHNLHTLWLHDANNNKTYSIPAPSHITLTSTAKVTFLGKNGLVLGHYAVPYGGSTSENYRYYPFAFSTEKGFTDLTDALAEASVGELVWDGSAKYIGGNSSGQIAGYGPRNDGRTTAFVLTPRMETGSNIAPNVSITSPNKSLELVEGDSVNFTANAWDADSNVTKVEYYAFGDQLIGTATVAPFFVKVDNVPYGTFDITAVAYDNSGNSTTSESVNIVVPDSIPPVSTPPTIAIPWPAIGKEFVEGASFYLPVNASDEDGSVTKVEFYAFGNQLFGTTTHPPFTFKVDSAPYGTYDITAVAYDNDGNTTTSNVVTVTVNEKTVENILPTVTITSPTDNSEIIEGSAVTFTVDASDTDGRVTKVEYYAFGDQLFGTVTQAPFTLNVGQAPSGTFDITAVVYDNEGASTVSPAIAVRVVEPTNLVD